MADKKRQHQGQNTSHIATTELFPSSELDRSDPNNLVPKALSDHADCIVPLLHFPIKDGIIFEWDMEDNFKAGDFIDTALHGVGKTEDDAYVAQQAVRYCDLFGRADLYTFRLFYKDNWEYAQAQALPKACIEPMEEESQMYLPKQYAIGLDKDCREELSFNYQINLIDSIEEDRGNFVFFSTLFGKKQGRLKLNLLNSIAPMFSESIQVDDMTSVAKEVEYTLQERENWIEIYIDKGQEKLKDIDLSKVKSLVWYDEKVEATTGITIKIPYIVKNLATVADAEKLNPLYIISIYGEEEKEKQGEKEDAE